MAIQSPEELFSILEKSNLLDAEQLLAARQSVQGLDDATLAARKLARDGLLTRWQAAQLLAGRSSFLLGKYKLIDLLGRGGMGRVFLGRHVTMQRPAALKIVSRDVGSNPAALERFLAEARAIAALDHPAIVQAYSVDCEGDRYYIVMEYVDGRDLQRVVEEDGVLEYPTAVEYIRQAADGLAHAHGRNLIHCDIKPSNLLVNRQGQVKILDMGMARLGGTDADGEGPEGNHILGSVDYLAPEQALSSDSFDHRADIYSLGCTLYFLLTGHPPFPEGTLSQRIVKHQTQQPRPLPTERPDVPSALVQVCRRMMAKRPEDRYQSAEELLASLAEVQTGEEAATEAATEAVAVAGPAGRAADGFAGMSAAASVPDAFAPIQQWLATTSGRLVLGGTALLVLALVAGVSIAIVAATGSRFQPELAERVVSPEPAEPGNTAEQERGEQEKREQEKREQKRGEPEKGEDYEFDLARAFAKRLEAGAGGSTAKPPAEQAATADPPAEGPGPTGQPGGEPGPPKEQASPGAPSEDAPDKPPQPKPEPSAPAEKPKPPEKAAAAHPLRDVRTTIDLAEGAKPGAVASIGALHLPKDAVLRIELLGGQTALRGNREYRIEREPPAGGTPQWLVKLQSEVPGVQKPVVDLARLDVAEQGHLRIAWLPETTAERIEALRNCALAVRVDKDTAWVAFGEPAPAEPLLVDFAKRIWRTTLISDALPETATLRIEVTGIDGKAPELEFKPANTVKEGEKMEVRLARPEAALMRLDVSFTVRGRALRVEAVPMFALPGVGQWPLSPRDVQRVGTQLAAQRTRLDIMLKSMPEKDPNRAKLIEARGQVEQAATQLAGLAEVHQDLNEQTRIHYRIFTTVGDRQIDLWTTEVAPGEASSADRRLPRNDRFGTPDSRVPPPPHQFVRKRH